MEAEPVAAAPVTVPQPVGGQAAAVQPNENPANEPQAAAKAAGAADNAVGAPNKENMGQDASQTMSHHLAQHSKPPATPEHSKGAAVKAASADDAKAAGEAAEPATTAADAKRSDRADDHAHPAAKPGLVCPLPASSSPVTPSPKAASSGPLAQRSAGNVGGAAKRANAETAAAETAADAAAAAEDAVGVIEGEGAKTPADVTPDAVAAPAAAAAAASGPGVR